MNETSDRDAIVVIDDDYAMRLSCRQILVKAGHRVEVFGDGAQGLAGVAKERPALVLVDLKMPGLSGLEVIRRIHEIDPSIVVVVITGYATVDTAIEAMKAGAYDFLSKPFSPDQLRMITGRALERRRLQQESRRAELERALVERRFVSFVSHQLKSPLAAVQQYLEVLVRLAGTPEIEGRREEWIARSLERIREMRALIDDWLTLARVEGNQLVGRREPVAVEPILRHLLELHGEAAAEREVSLALELAPGTYVVEGDPTCLGVLFENLLDNAIKYNRPGGSVTVAGELVAGEVVVTVRDTGEGIPPEALPRLFDELFQVERPAGSTVSGTGLGLPICRRIAHELGGQIEVESTPGEGALFRVRLPAQRTAETAAEAPAETPLEEPAAEPTAAPSLEPVEVIR